MWSKALACKCILILLIGWLQNKIGGNEREGHTTPFLHHWCAVEETAGRSRSEWCISCYC